MENFRWRTPLIVLVVCAAALRLVYASQVELLPEEAYYWNYSRHLDIGYLDHPPMVAWLIRLGTSLFGSTEFGVRFGALCCGVIAGIFLWRLTRNVFGPASALFAVTLAVGLPFFFFSGVLMTPDAPLTAAWAGALYFLERALIGGRPGAWAYAGLALGLGLVSKYTIGLLGIATVVFVILDPGSRQWLRRWEPYAAVLIAVAVFSPVIIWNAQHEWASFAFQTSRRLAEAPRFSLQRLVAALLVLLTPVGVVLAVPALAKLAGLRAGRYLRVAVLTPLTVFVVFSFRHEVKLDWTGAPSTALLPLLAGVLATARAGEFNLPRRRWLPNVWLPTIAVMMVLYAVGAWYLVAGLPGVGYSTHTELLPVGWREFGRQVDSIAADARASYGDRLLVVGMDRYAIASELAFYSANPAQALADTTSAHLFDYRGLMYERWFPVEQQTGRPLLLVSFDPADLSDARLGARAIDLRPIHAGELIRRGRPVRPFYYRLTGRYGYP